MVEAEEGKTKVKWQNQQNAGAADGNDSTSVNSGFEEQTSRSGLGIFGFLFSAPGILLMFVAINYPWIKTLVVGNSSSSPTPVSAPTPVAVPKVKSSSPVKMATKMSSSSSSSATTLELSPPCKNPLKRIFDRTCRQELKQLRMEKKREKLRLQKERQERKRRRRELESLGAAAGAGKSFANATKANTKIQIDTGASSSSPSGLKIVNVNQFECNNILSRECRQKKRLMQQMKEALN
mmetsp:Transcript_104196/g.156025  ORF Transcript_104196/g.156025 Transcript_104196/m.156025 type:complete len:237 (+) Transcript_104196:319-1029(+)